MAKKDISMEVGRLIETKIRESFGSNLSFAVACGVDEKTVRNVLAGKNISLKLLKKMCEALNVKVSTLLSEAGL
jgi:transcriptional regulator with XRE-family HTH domain